MSAIDATGPRPASLAMTGASGAPYAVALLHDALPRRAGRST